MVIKNNLNAINALNKLNINVVNIKKSTEKLSSGFRINRASDDAAGLAISEKMRAQIRGINQAIRNANDGISLLQTAEGALDESHAMLKRLKELTVQSANDTYSDEERSYMQMEVNQIKEEIDRISKATDFNGIKLLDGSLSGGGTSSSSITDLGARYGIREYSAAFSQNIMVSSDIAGVSIQFTTDNVSAKGGETAVWDTTGTRITINLAQNASYTDEQINALIQNADRAKATALYQPATVTWKTDSGMITAADFTTSPTVAGVQQQVTMDLSPFSKLSSSEYHANIIRFTANQYGSHVNTPGLFSEIGIMTNAAPGQERVSIDTQALNGVAGARVTLHLATGTEYTAQDIENILMKSGFDYTVEMWSDGDKAPTGDSVAYFTNVALSRQGMAPNISVPNNSNVFQYLYGTWLADAASVIADRAGLMIAQDFTMEVKFGYEDADWVARVWVNPNGGYSQTPILEFNAKYIDPNGDFANPDGTEIEGDTGLYMDRLIVHEMTHALMYLNANPGIGSSIPLWYTEGLAEAVHGFNRYTYSNVDLLVNWTRLDNEIQALTNSTTNSTVYSAGYLFVSWLDNYGIPSASGGKIADLSDAMKTASSFNAALIAVFGKDSNTLLSEFKFESTTARVGGQAVYEAWLDTNLNIQLGDGLEDALKNQDANKSDIVPNGGGKQDVGSVSDTVIINGNTVTLVWNFTNVDSKSSPFISAFEGMSDEERLNAVYEALYIPGNISLSTIFGGSDGQGLGRMAYDMGGGAGLTLQIGANNAAEQRLTVNIGNMSSSVIGISGIDVSTVENALKSMSMVEGAIRTVSRQRASLGAKQNRLEHTVNSLTAQAENLIAAESQIRDTDMAMEMVKYTKYQILQQASQAMLTQAIQQPQAILQLLKAS